MNHEDPVQGLQLSLDPDAVLWSCSEHERAGRPLLVLLHGYGADQHDLFSLAPLLPSELAVAAVRAPLPMPVPSAGAAWYPIEGLGARDGRAVTEGARAFLRWLEGADARRVLLLGFSQGAAIALQSVRLEPERFTCVLALSGYAAADALPGDAALQELRPPVFWGRGDRDPVIPPHLVEHTARWLPAHSTLTRKVYTGLGHGIDERELADVQEFLAQHLGALG